jgi:hypothetical protein
MLRPGSLSRYSDWLRAGRSGDRMPVWAIFFAHVETGPGPTQPSVQWVPGLSRGLSDRGVVLITHPLLAPRSRKGRAIPVLPLWAFGSVTGYRFTFTSYPYMIVEILPLSPSLSLSSLLRIISALIIFVVVSHMNMNETSIETCRMAPVCGLLTKQGVLQPCNRNAVLLHLCTGTQRPSVTNSLLHYYMCTALKYRVINKFLCTWWLQCTSFLPRYLAQSDCLAADRQGQGDTRLTLSPSVITNANYVIMVNNWNCLKYFTCFWYCNQVHRDFLITLYLPGYKLSYGTCIVVMVFNIITVLRRLFYSRQLK